MPVTDFFGHLNRRTGLTGGVTGALSANVVLQPISNKMRSPVFIEIASIVFIGLTVLIGIKSIIPPYNHENKVLTGHVKNNMVYF
jgi:flagellar motor component MotA